MTATYDDLKKWLNDCITTAKKEGISDHGITLAFLEITSALMLNEVLNWDKLYSGKKKRNSRNNK